MDIYKCPKSKTLLDFCFNFVTEKHYQNNTNKYNSIYARITKIIIVMIKIEWYIQNLVN
jgi:hypothetical protein